MNDKFYTELGSELKAGRKFKGYTQQYVADRIKVSRSCIASWENGARQITIDDVFKLCDLYGLDVNVLVKRVKKYL